jgi:two-component system, NtrC family, sensor kinase
LTVPSPEPVQPSIDEGTLQREKLATLGELTAAIAHELNNPIGYIASNLNTLGKYAATLVELIEQAGAAVASEQRGQWQNLLREARWEFMRKDLGALIDESRAGANLLKDVVGELKLMVRQSGRESLTPDVCVRAALSILSHHFKHQVRIETRLSATRTIVMVRSQIVQLAINLLHNAIQALSGPGVVRITTADDGDTARIMVEDSGPGVPEDMRKKIFQTYFTTKSGGTGLGLAIVKRIANDHGGDVALCASSDLSGACFTVTLRGLAPESEP